MQIKIIIVSCHTANSKPAKQEVNGTVILPLWYSLFGVYIKDLFASSSIMSEDPLLPVKLGFFAETNVYIFSMRSVKLLNFPKGRESAVNRVLDGSTYPG